MRNEHYDKMKTTSDIAISVAVTNGYPIDIVGASPTLCDLNLTNQHITSNINFIDINANILNSISKIILNNPCIKFIHQDITGMNKQLKNTFTEIYKNNSDPNIVIEMIIKECNNLDIKCDYNFGGKVFLSLNVISELQPPIRAYIEKLHRFYFNESIKNTISKKLYVELKQSNRFLYNKYVVSHLKLSKNFLFSNYIISIYEDNKSYIDPLGCISPSDYQSQKFVERYVDLFKKPMFWDWKISETRNIRIMQFFVNNGD